MPAKGLPTRGATNEANSLSIVLATTNKAHVFTDDRELDKFLIANQPIVRSVCQVPITTGRKTRLT